MMSALAPDARLTELERTLLDAHLARCVRCSAFAVGVEAVTAAVRSAELVPLEHPIHVRAWRRRAFTRARNAVATAAVALMAFGLASRGPLPVQEGGFVEREAARTIAFAADTEQELREMRQARRQELIAAGSISILPVRRSGTQPS